MDVKEIGWDCEDWIDLAQGTMAGFCEHDTEPPGSIKQGNFLTSRGTYKTTPLQRISYDVL
jgi:hypothetical protein